MDWSRFRFEYRCEHAALRAVLIRIEALKEAAMSLLLPAEWKKRLNLLNRVRTVHGSTALEGNPLSEAQVTDLLAGDGIRDAEGKAARQIRNADTAQNWVRDRFSPGRRPIAVEDILHMHRLMTEGSDETNNTPGRLRSHPVTVGTPELGGVHRGAPHADLPSLMAAFAEFVNSRQARNEHPVVRALLAHFFLVTIHPFGDGNGRVSRLVEAAILYEGGYNVHGFYGLSNYFYRHGDDYRMRLQECRRTQPFSLMPFIEFGLRGFEAELRGINSFIKVKLNRVVYRNMLTQALGERISKRRRLLNVREYQLLEFLLHETEPEDPFSDEPSRQIRLDALLDSPYVRAAYRDVTQRTFVRELMRLTDLGFLKFAHRPESDDHTVEVDFGAIEIDFDMIERG